MANYVLPQVQVFQDVAVAPAAAINPLRAHISGPHAFLLRYANADEQPLSLLGYYDPVLTVPYAWPERPAGAVVDPDYTKVYVKDALLQYLQDSISAGSTITKTAGYSNRIRSATLNFAENGDDYPRAASLLDRDVKAGDVAKVRGLNGDGDSVTLWTYVRDLVGDTVAGDVDDAEADASNQDTQVSSASVSKTAGVENCVTATASATGYDGRPSGYVDETYDILVTGSSINNDFTTALLRIISGSGTDDAEDVSPAAEGVAFEVGTRGLTVTFGTDDGSCSLSADDAEVSPVDLIVGQRWRVTVTGEFTAPTVASGGTYDGAADTTYTVRVSRGGLFADSPLPQITVTTVNGIDLSGPTTVTASGAAIDVGSNGVTIAFTGDGLRTGDVYYIPVTAEAEGPMRTIVLGHNLDSEIADGSEVDLTLFIRVPDLLLPKNQVDAPPLTNWDQDDTEITINEGAMAYDDSWTDDGVPQPLPVISESSKQYGRVYVEYRAWRAELCGQVNGIYDVGDLDDISGALTPDNPLKWGVFKALENSNGTEVKYTAVCDPADDDSWVDVLELLVGRDDVYGLVPLTRKQTVLDLYAAHVKSRSTPEQTSWRSLWVSLAGVPMLPLVAASSEIPGHLTATTTDGEVCLCVVEDDADTSGTQFTIVRCTSNNGNFLTNGVRAGDIVRINYTGDGFGNLTYGSYVIDEVQTEDQLRLVTGPSAGVSVGSKTEIWRNLSATQEAAELAQNSGAWGDKRIVSVWPDTIDSGTTVNEGYFLCCSLAGLVSGVLPQQGLTHLEVVGYTDVPRTARKFNRTQLDAMAVAGTWIVTQDLVAGNIFTRHAVTTGSYDDINAREEMVRRNLDSISYRYRDELAPFIGVTNVTPTTMARLRLEAEKLTRTLIVESFRQDLGGQLLEGSEITDVAVHPTLRDTFVISLNAVLPYAVNVIEHHIIVS